MPHDLPAQLDRLSQLRARLQSLDLTKAAQLRRLIPEDHRAEYDALDATYAEMQQMLAYDSAVVEAEIKGAVLAQGVSAAGEHLQAVWVAGKVHWNTRALERYMARHPEVKDWRTQGEA